MKKSYISAIEYYLPDQVLTNAALASQFPEYSEDKIFKKTGIQCRHIAAQNEYASDLAIYAAKKLFQNNTVLPEEVDFLIFCTQTPDYLLPAAACLIQERLGLSQEVGALDVNLGCSGYVYGLSLAKGLIESGQANNILFLTGDTYTKLLKPSDKSVRTIFGDGASATLISAKETHELGISASAYGTNGQGANDLCVLGRGMRGFLSDTHAYLQMNGPKIFTFTLQVVPTVIKQALNKAALGFEEIDLFIFHQANAYMLEHLRKKLNIPLEKFFVAMDFCGNTVSSTIPIALVEANKKGILSDKKNIMLVGFGVGLSWAACVVDLSYFPEWSKYE